VYSEFQEGTAVHAFFSEDNSKYPVKQALLHIYVWFTAIHFLVNGPGALV
jgi:hypothetical protein